MGRQWHYWPCDDGSGLYDAWDAGRLEDLARGRPAHDLVVAHVAELDTEYWVVPGEAPTVRTVVLHARLALAVDTSRPVVLRPDGAVMDGMHRIVRALLEGRESIPAVRLDPLPAPDERGVALGSLS